jgi:hypothetical protein
MGSVMTRTAGAGLALCIGALCASGAYGQSPRGASGRLGEMLFGKGSSRKPATPPVARYQAEGSVAFVLDRSSGQPLIQFEGSNEVWALYPQAAPRGDVIYNNDVGQPVLRLWRGGGVTVFTSNRPEGVAAALDGVGGSLRLPRLPKDVERSFDRLKAATNRTSRAARRPIGVDVPEVGPDSLAVAVDAALVAFEAFDRLLKSDRNAGALGRIGQVLVLEGKAPDVTVRQGSLVITVVPGRGVAGRPSSAKIQQALKG